DDLVYQRIASMIINGEGVGTPWTPPAPSAIPAAVRTMFANAVQKANVQVNVFTAGGLPVTDACVIRLNDWITNPVTTTSGSNASATFNAINLAWNTMGIPGTWTATVINTATGDRLTRNVAPSNGQTVTLNLSLPAKAPQWFAGSGASYNGIDNMHP